MKALVLLSGGMDSAVALGLVVKMYGSENVETVTFNYGSKHNVKENLAAQRLAEYYTVKNHFIELPFVNKLFKSALLQSGEKLPEGHFEDPIMKKTVVPFRNGIMLSIVAGLAESLGSEKIVLANHAGDHAIYPDCRAEFSEAMRQAIKLGLYNAPEFYSPFQFVDKTAIALIGQALGVPWALTYTCYNGGEVHCGKCGSCCERLDAFKKAGVHDQVAFAEESKC